ncbi:MAG TPA: tyrosine-type recombinase/integrase [Nitrososphaeraceae archaeon]
MKSRSSIIATVTNKPDFETSNAFLSSMLRNSRKSKLSYESGLNHFQRFLQEKYSPYNIQSILKPLSKNETDLYKMLEGFISYILATNPNLTPNSIKSYMAAVRSYLAYYDIDVIPSKFRRKVKMPKLYREDEEPLDVSDIRRILLSCNNRRLKAYLLVLASGGMRAVEGLAIRLKDVDFSVSPTRIHIRKEYAKTRVARDIYISDEATHYLKQWLDWKYKNEERPRNPNPDDLVFTVYRSTKPNVVYVKILKEFEKLLGIAGLDDRKEEGVQKRRKITLHSFRRFVKTVISDQTNQDYSEWFLGHNKSPYYTKKESERREIYATKCMKYLTFLDYSTLEATGKNIESKLSEKEKEIQLLRQRDSMNTDAIATLSDQLTKVMQEIEILKKQR